MHTLALVTDIDTGPVGSEESVWTAHIESRNLTKSEDDLEERVFTKFSDCDAYLISLGLHQLGETNMYVADCFTRIECGQRWNEFVIVFNLDEKDGTKRGYTVPIVTDFSKRGIWLTKAAAFEIIDAAYIDAFDYTDTSVAEDEVDLAMMYAEIFLSVVVEEEELLECELSWFFKSVLVNAAQAAAITIDDPSDDDAADESADDEFQPDESADDAADEFQPDDADDEPDDAADE